MSDDDELFTPDGDLVGAEEAALLREEYAAACASGDLSESEMQFAAYAASVFAGCAPPMCTSGTEVAASAAATSASNKPSALTMADTPETGTNGIFDDVVDAVDDGARAVVDDVEEGARSVVDDAEDVVDDVTEDVDDAFGIDEDAHESDSLSAASTAALSAEVVRAADALDDGGDAPLARHYGGAHVVQHRQVMRTLAAQTEATFATSYDSSSADAASVDTLETDPADSDVTTGISFVQQLRAREGSTDPGAGAYPYELTARALLQDLQLVAAHARSADAFASALSAGASAHLLGVELYATLGGLEDGDVRGRRADALGDAATHILDTASVDALAAAGTGGAAFAASAEAIAGAFADGGGAHDAAMGRAMAAALRAAPIPIPISTATVAAASASALALTNVAAAYESLPVGALTDRFTNKMDKAWGGFVREIVRAASSKNVDPTPRSLYMHAALAFKNIFDDLTRTKAATPEADIRRFHLTLAPIATQLMRVAGTKLHRYPFAALHRDYLGSRFRDVAFDPVGSPFDSLRTEFTFRGKVKKGLGIIMNRAAKGGSAASIAEIATQDTRTFLAPFIERRTGVVNDEDSAKSKLDVAALFVTVAAGILLYAKLRDSAALFLEESNADIAASTEADKDTLSIIETGIRANQGDNEDE